MEHLSVPRVALLGWVFGSTIAFGWMGAVAARSAWAVTRGGRWYQARQLAGLK